MVADSQSQRKQRQWGSGTTTLTRACRVPGWKETRALSTTPGSPGFRGCEGGPWTCSGHPEAFGGCRDGHRPPPDLCSPRAWILPPPPHGDRPKVPSRQLEITDQAHMCPLGNRTLSLNDNSGSLGTGGRREGERDFALRPRSAVCCRGPWISPLHTAASVTSSARFPHPRGTLWRAPGVS